MNMKTATSRRIYDMRKLKKLWCETSKERKKNNKERKIQDDLSIMSPRSLQGTRDNVYSVTKPCLNYFVSQFKPETG